MQGLAALENRNNTSYPRVATFKCQMAAQFLRVVFILAGAWEISHVLICMAVTSVLQGTADILQCYTIVEEENNALALQNLQANVRQNSTYGSRQGKK